MYLLSVQGRYAPAFHLNNAGSQALKQHVETLTNQNTLLISSRFRSDLVYEDHENRLEYFLETWCQLAGYPYDKSVKLKFFRSAEEAVSISQFFYRLHLLKRFPVWYNAYLEKLVNVLIHKEQCSLCYRLAQAMEKFCEAVEMRRLKEDRQVLINSVQEFVKLKHLSSLIKESLN